MSSMLYLNSMKQVLKLWLPLFITFTIIYGFIYWAIQQNYRLNANDPQIQMATDAGIYLSGGGNYTFNDNGKTEISKSLAPYLMLFDKNKKLVSYSAVLHGKAPVFPTGVLDNAKGKDYSKLTWQPEDGVRSAIVAVYYKGIKEGYAVVGKSLREVEIRETLLLQQTIIAWLLTTVFSFIIVFAINNKLKLRKTN